MPATHSPAATAILERLGLGAENPGVSRAPMTGRSPPAPTR